MMSPTSDVNKRGIAPYWLANVQLVAGGWKDTVCLWKPTG